MKLKVIRIATNKYLQLGDVPSLMLDPIITGGGKLINKFLRNIEYVKKTDMANYINPLNPNGEWELSDVMPHNYILHPYNDKLLIESKQFIGYILNEQCEQILDYCGNNSKIKHVKIEINSGLSYSFAIDGEVDEVSGGVNSHNNKNNSISKEINVNEHEKITNTSNLYWLDSFPEVTGLINRFSSGEAKTHSEFDYSFGLSISAMKKINLSGEKSEKKLLTIEISS